MANIVEFRIPVEKLQQIKNPMTFMNMINEGKTVEEILGYSLAAMDRFYQAARRLFEKQQFRDAGCAFVFLTTLNPRVYVYWLGLGMSEQLAGEYFSALLAYGMASMVNPTDPLPYYHSAACYHALSDKDNTAKSLELAIHFAGDLPEYAAVKTHAVSILAACEDAKSWGE